MKNAGTDLLSPWVVLLKHLETEKYLQSTQNTPIYGMILWSQICKLHSTVIQFSHEPCGVFILVIVNIRRLEGFQCPRMLRRIHHTIAHNSPYKIMFEFSSILLINHFSKTETNWIWDEVSRLFKVYVNLLPESLSMLRKPSKTSLNYCMYIVNFSKHCQQDFLQI